MVEFVAGGVRYKTRALCAVDQFALLAKLRSVFPALQGMDRSLRVEGLGVNDVVKSLSPLVAASDNDLRTAFRACVSAVEQVDGTEPAEAPRLEALMRIATQVVADNFSTLFKMKRPRFEPILTDSVSFKAVEMPDGEDWLFRPVARGYCRIESLYDGTLKIEHIAKANDVLDVEDENATRAQKAAEKK